MDFPCFKMARAMRHENPEKMGELYFNFLVTETENLLNRVMRMEYNTLIKNNQTDDSLITKENIFYMLFVERKPEMHKYYNLEEFQLLIRLFTLIQIMEDKYLESSIKNKFPLKDDNLDESDAISKSTNKKKILYHFFKQKCKKIQINFKLSTIIKLKLDEGELTDITELKENDNYWKGEIKKEEEKKKKEEEEKQKKEEDAKGLSLSNIIDNVAKAKEQESFEMPSF